MSRIKTIYKTSFSQSQGNKTLFAASQKTVHAQSFRFSQLRNSNLHKNLNRALQLILLCFYCTMSPCNETPECHLPEDIICARSKALCGIQPRWSSASSSSQLLLAQQFLSRAPQTWRFHVKTLTRLAGAPGMAQSKCSLKQMLSVNSGITDRGISWITPMATPRKSKAMMIWRIWERQQCFKCLQPSGFDGTGLMPNFHAHNEVNIAIDQNWLWMQWLSCYSGKSSWIRSTGESWHGMLCIFIKGPMHL